ncbi:hypothetical protein JCM10914A_52260 [Paenibacillus sp. JCM 10914]
MNSLTWLLLALFILVDIVIIAYFIKRFVKKKNEHPPLRQRNRRQRFLHAPEPPAVTEPQSPAHAIAARLESSMPSSLPGMVRQRVLTEHTEMTEREYEWRWLELKRFFVMCAVLDRVPMFSKAVDEIWHEMLMYTYEYQQFSDRFLGRMLHHAPNPGGENIPMHHERAWFDTIYVELFGWSEYSAALWGPFFRVPLPREELEEFRYPNSFVENERFNQWTYEHIPEAAIAIDTVTNNLKQRLIEAQDSPDHETHGKQKVNFGNQEVLLAAAVYFAWYHADDYANQMVPDDRFAGKNSGAACSYAAACGSGGDNKGDASSSNDSGSSCSGSSCSSCGGGGCSS